MITINLLSPEKKHEQLLRVLFRHIKIVLEIALFLALCIAMVAIGTKLFLTDTLLTMTTTARANVRIRTLERTVQRTNQILALLDRLHGETTQWSGVLLRLTEIAPPTIAFTELTMQKKPTPRLILKGKATTRNDLLVFKTALEKLPFLTELQFPLTNLLTPKDIDWQVSAALTIRETNVR